MEVRITLDQSTQEHQLAFAIKQSYLLPLSFSACGCSTTFHYTVLEGLQWVGGAVRLCPLQQQEYAKIRSNF